MNDATPDNPIPTIQQQLQELEQAYAECLADDVDRETLRILYLQIKVLRRALIP